MRKNLKNYFLFIPIIFAQILSAQDRDAFQPDSIYKANKVKHCQVLGSNGYHYSNTYFDTEGRIVRLVKSDNQDLNQFDKY
ncbi:MAG: hypothetical protein R8G66_28215 [Cytophagales bacterium]|nr:hypothetical protein [Cytophagales bacterium]